MKKSRVFVLGLDGMPYSLLKKLIAQGHFSNFKKIFGKENFKELKSVYPVISSVAWTSYSTGKNPGEHGIYGFVDRNPNPFDVFVLSSKDIRSDPIWKTLSEKNKNVVVINVPITYPVEPLNGKIISCFLCPDINKGTYPHSISQKLIKENYIIDADATIVNIDKDKFFQQIMQAAETRFKIAHEYMLENNWDYFHLHIMETDRHMHFFWDSIKNIKNIYHNKTLEFYNLLDSWIGKLIKNLNQTDSLLLLSDHGFCEIEKEVGLNSWLSKEGFLKIKNADSNLLDYSNESLAYSLVPGRIYINLKGREENGTVEGKDYDRIRAELKDRLLDFKDPNNNKNIIKHVFYKEDIYRGPCSEFAPDLIVHPNNGYDLKSFSNSDEVLFNSNLEGMHTYENAFIASVNLAIDSVCTIQDVHDLIIKKLL